MPMVCVTDFEAHARELLCKSTWDYIEGGADDDFTRDDNIAAFKKFRLRPRYLRDVSQVDTRTTVQGQEISAPICISPTGFHCLAWPDGEMSTARAAQAAGICYITSTYASCTLEDIVAAAPRGLRWFQLYVQTDRQLTQQLIQRVESLGFKALVITVDVPKTGNRRQNIRNQLDLKKMLMLKDLRSPKEGNSAPRLQMSLIDSSFCWNDLSWIQSITRLPIILKGILTKEDAELALKHKVDGIIVSNHGGRQLDGVPASKQTLEVKNVPFRMRRGTKSSFRDVDIRTSEPGRSCPPSEREMAEGAATESPRASGAGCTASTGASSLKHRRGGVDALPEVVAAVKGSMEVYMDGGIRTGNDVLKALALGAKCVFLGRPILWGLAYKGEHGVEEVLNMLKDEFHTSMALSGCRSVAEISQDLVQVSRL